MSASTRKVFIRFLLHHTALQGEQVVVCGLPVEFVWIQGVVVDVNSDANEVILDDGTDTILVSTEDIPVSLVAELTVGAYLMVQGEVILGEDDFGKIVVVKARLLYNLSYDVNLESLWQQEVIAAFSLVKGAHNSS